MRLAPVLILDLPSVNGTVVKMDPRHSTLDTEGHRVQAARHAESRTAAGSARNDFAAPRWPLASTYTTKPNERDGGGAKSQEDKAGYGNVPMTRVQTKRGVINRWTTMIIDYLGQKKGASQLALIEGP